MSRPVPAVLLVLLLAVPSIGATAPDPREVPAAARTTVQLLAAELSQPDGSVTDAGLGELRLVSVRDGVPVAALDAVGAAVAGESAPTWQVRSRNGDERSGEAALTLPRARNVDAALQLGDYLVRALGYEAISSVSAIQGELGVASLDLRVDNIGPALTTSVTDVSTSSTSLELGAIELALGDLLPAGLIDRLPLGLTIDLLGQLPVALPTVEELLASVERLVADLTAAGDAAAALRTTREELNDLVGDAPGVAAAEEAVAAAEATLAEATAALEVARDDRDTARTALADAEATLTGALADAAEEEAELQAALDTAEQELADAEASLATAGATAAAAQQTVDDLTADLDAVRDEIAILEAELATLDPVTDALRITEIENELEELEAQETQLEADLAAAQSDLTGATAAVTGAETDLAEAEQAVADATAALDDTSPAVTDARAAVDAAEAELTGADEAVAAARAAVDAAETTLADATAALDDVVEGAAELLGGTTAELRQELIRIRGEVERLVDEVTSHAVTLPDLAALLDDLRSGLAGVPVVSLGGVSFDVALEAGPDGPTASVDCSIDAISVFGQTLTNPTCAEAGDLLGTVPAELVALTDVLPIDELPLPRIAGLRVDTDRGVHGNGVAWATATVTGLALEVPAVSLNGLRDHLTQRLDGLLADALAAARALPDGSATSTGRRFTTTNVLSALGDLRGQLDDLPLGTQLQGLRTLGVEVTIGHLVAEVVHGAAADGPLDLGSPFDAAAPGPGDDAPDPDPGGPATGPPSLPATGGGVTLLPLGLIGAAALLRRKRD